MAGRGTDIKLGGPREEERDRVAALGGLYVIGTNRHESLRIDNQLRGRSGRQGDPGSSRFFISLEDDVFERYGLGRRLFSRYRLRTAGGGGRRRAPPPGDRPRPARHRGPQPRHPPGPLELLHPGRHAEADRRGLARRRIRAAGGGGAAVPAVDGARRRRGLPVRARGLRPAGPPGRALPHRPDLGRPPGLARRPARGHPPRLARPPGAAHGVPEGGDRRVPGTGEQDRRGDGRHARLARRAPGPRRPRRRGTEGAVLDLDLSRQRGPARLGRRAAQGHERRLHVRGRRPLRPALRPDHPGQAL